MLSLIWGVCNFGLLKCLVSQATLAFKKTPAGLIPSLLLAASLGTACSPLASSWVVEALGVAAGIMTGPGEFGSRAAVGCRSSSLAAGHKSKWE